MILLQKATEAYNHLIQRPVLNTLLWFVIALLLYGIGVSPFQDYLRISQDPFVTDPSAPFYQDSVLLPLVTHYLGLYRNLRLFLLACLLTIALAYGVYARLAYSQFQPKLAAIVPMTLALHPISLLLLNWLGTVDGLTVMFSGVLAFSQSPLIIFGAATVGAMNHPQMIVIAASIALLRLASGNETFWPRKLLALVAGSAVGYATARIFLYANGIEATPGRLSIMLSPGIGYWWSLHVKELPLSIFSLYNGLWFVLAACLVYGFRKRPKYYSAFLAVQLASLVLAFLSWDLTRVFGLLTVASTLHCVLYTLSLAKSRGTDFKALYATCLVFLLASLFMPKYYAWYGTIVHSQIADFWKLLGPTLANLPHSLISY